MGLCANERDPTELSSPFPDMHGHKEERAVCNPEEVLSRLSPCWHPDLGLPASRTARNTFL